MRFPTITDIPKYFTNRNIATITIFIMTTQLVFVEGYSISPLKVCLMALMPFILIFKVPYVTKSFIWGGIYLVSIIVSGLMHIETFRFSTVGYLCMFVITFITMYNLIHAGAISLSFFIKFVRWMILAYAICLLCQQILILVGIRFMPIVNLDNQFFLSIDKLPSLSIEPSHSARILGVFMYAYMECISFRDGANFKLKNLFEKEHKWVTISFLWSMLTMGSGTAFIVLGVLSLYFINLRNSMIVIPIIVGIVFIGSKMGIEQFDRAYNTAQATMTLDRKVVAETDGSAVYRIGPMLNTIKNLDLTKKEHWFGYGIDNGIMSEAMVSEITSYGFLSYILGLILVFSCAIRFVSIPTIMFFIGIGGGTANIAYLWGILIVFTCVRFFYNKNNFYE